VDHHPLYIGVLKGGRVLSIWIQQGYSAVLYLTNLSCSTRSGRFGGVSPVKLVLPPYSGFLRFGHESGGEKQTGGRWSGIEPPNAAGLQQLG
jgi:hypothetical protein